MVVETRRGQSEGLGLGGSPAVSVLLLISLNDKITDEFPLLHASYELNVYT